MSATAARAEDEIAKICRKIGVTENGKRWLDICLDPCKDMVVEKSGYPDAIAVPSAIETIHDQLVVSVPAGVAAGANWDCNIFLDQLYTSNNLYLTSTINNAALRAGQAATGYPRGGLIVRSGPSAAPLTYLTTTGNLSLKPDTLAEGEFRIVGIGLEIHNTTAELNVQGSVITWRDPDGPEDTGVVTVMEDNGVTACVPTAYKSVVLAKPPETTGEAIDLPNALQWLAKDGAYIVPILANPTLEVTETAFLAPTVKETAGTAMFPLISTTGVAKRISISSLNNQTGFCMAGAFFSGLSYATTLQVNLTYYIQIFPFSTSVLRRFTQVSTGEDATAIKLYDKIASHLPTGVYVTENFLGGFIAGVSKIAQNVVRYAPQIARVGGAVLDFMSDAGMTSQKKSRGEEKRGMSGGFAQSIVEPVISIPRSMPNTMQIVPYNPPQQILKPTHNQDVVVKYHKNDSGKVTSHASVVRTNQSKAKRHVNSTNAHNQAIYNAYKGQTGSRWIEERKKRSKN